MHETLIGNIKTARFHLEAARRLLQSNARSPESMTDSEQYVSGWSERQLGIIDQELAQLETPPPATRKERVARVLELMDQAEAIRQELADESDESYRLYQKMLDLREAVECNLNRTAQAYPFIRAWGAMMSSGQEYIEAEVRAALEEEAPETAIYRSAPRPNGSPSVWSTLEEVVNPDVRCNLEEWVRTWKEEQLV